MSQALAMGGQSFEVTADGGQARPTGGGFLLPPGRVEVGSAPAAVSFYRHGWNSWSPTGWVEFAGVPLRVLDPVRRLVADDAATDDPTRHSGSAVGALRDASGRVLLLGALGLGSPRVEADANGLRAWAQDAGGEWFVAFGSEVDVFDAYAAHLAARLGRRTLPAPRVWCTWYSSYEEIDEAAVADRVRGLAGMPFDVVQIDDGWQRSVGDWEANDRFAAGMPAIAARIADAGFTPGLWLAPLTVRASSALAAGQPELLVRDADGRPAVVGRNWGDDLYAIDTTRTATQDLLVSLMERVVGWGFGYLKLDFMYAGAVAGTRATGVPREQVYRDALQLIRDAVGPEVYLLGSGVPVLPSLGLVDGMRVGPDTAAYWQNIAIPDDPTSASAGNALRASAHRAWLATIVHADPDVVYFRRRRSLLDDAQRQAAQDLASVYGFRATSDPMDWLDETERAALRAWLDDPRTGRWLGGRRFDLGGRTVDLDGLLGAGYAPPVWSIAE